MISFNNTGRRVRDRVEADSHPIHLVPIAYRGFLLATKFVYDHWATSW